MSIFSKFGLSSIQKRHIAIEHIGAGFLPFALAKIIEETGGKAMFVARDGQQLDALQQALYFISADIEALQFPGWDCLPYDRVSPSQHIIAKRVAALGTMASWQNEPPNRKLILTTVNALCQKLPPRSIFADRMHILRPGQKYSLEKLVHYLGDNSFERVATVRDVGEFAVRGGIVDLYVPGLSAPVRLDFFGDVLETIREFDPSTQRSQREIAHFNLQPMSEISLSAERIGAFRTHYRQQFGAPMPGDALYEAISQGRRFAGQEHWLPLFYPQLETLFDHAGDMPVIFDHLAHEALQERYILINEYYQARCEQRELATKEAVPYHPIEPDALYLDPPAVLQAQSQAGIRIDLNAFTIPATTAAHILESGVKPGHDFARERQDQNINLFEVVVEHIALLRKDKCKIMLAGWSEGSLERLKQILEEHGLKKIDLVASLSVVKAMTRDRITAAIMPIEHGFVSDDLVVITEQDILGDRLIRATARRKRPADFISEADSINVGDLVVHVEHGIGRFSGLKTITAAGAAHDCLEIHYANEDRLFLPVENIELLSRFGGEAASVVLDKLGGVAWQARKAKLKKHLLAIAGHLIKIAAARQTRHAPILTVPDGLYDEFVARFPYDETDDQISAIEATLKDLAAGKPMDRLICGDVGFGKTEVALRAAFVAALGGVQVAVVVPTTLLARQHSKNFLQRFSGLPLKIAQASRLVGAKELAQVKQGIANGQIDIVIGTHALLSQSVNFANLGLLIIDEEQHFGVKHKERLKELKSDIHVLTLSATPIPRTLQLALSGVRELSLIATPPVDRMVVRSFVTPFDPLILRETLLREHYRGGQSFYVCPRISDLDEIKTFLEQQVPELKVQIAHGQMPAGQLDDIMNGFYDGQYDVLLSTSIVESGLDIPTANTLIVHRADMFGLSALYQLRGRVGRSKVRAYALFTLPANRLLTRQAEKRLNVLQSLDTLGAGFQLASHDMDIRGSGNLLGEEQSGHIKEVGFELYQQMLEEAVAEMKGEASTEEGGWSPQISVGTSVMIPENYVPDLQLRLGLYRRLSDLQSAQEIEAFAAEMIDRFGPLPEEVDHLLKIVEIKSLCRQANIEKMEAGPKGVVISFRHNNFANGVGLVKWIGAQGADAKIRPDHSIVFIRNGDKPEQRLKFAKKIAAQLAELAAQSLSKEPIRKLS